MFGFLRRKAKPVVTTQLVAQVKRHEGTVRHDDGRHKLYKDSLGIYTIGYGINLEVGLDEDEAEMLLLHRLQKTANRIYAHPDMGPDMALLDEVRQEVILNMAFNIGVEGVARFRKMWLAIRRGDFVIAANEMLDSRWADQVGPRAIELSAQMKAGRRLK